MTRIAKLFTFGTTIMMLSSQGARADDKGGLHATIVTFKGDIRLVLYPEDAPVTVANFCNLAQRGYYDGLRFHRVIKDFMIQGGCPQGTGSGSPGYKFKDECTPNRKHDGPGVLSMANSGPATNGSQFFVTHKETPWLDGKHTVFGRVEKGQDVVNAIAQNDAIRTIRIEGDTKAVFEKAKAELDEWNKTLDRGFPKRKSGKEAIEEAASHLKTMSLDPAKFTTSDMGVSTLDTAPGTGAQPTLANRVKLHCTGFLANGTKFWSSRDGKNEPFVSPVSNFVPGFTEAVLGMKAGGKRVVVFPGCYGYGFGGNPQAKIPPNATLVFEIEMIAIEG